ncbi:hypothetical protein [Tunicatimonas pelagia]|uniref:hypothetical protein n=1 Tax=Tunicatimonas pelagia TaxID=931531 RepID=UPI002666A2E5|nr:hypothetical protein [Tunicatimonas pelagia]WKN42143.1 hypothetical protein P0M28_24205 [Tunicatimonas pelagia]
MKIIGLICLLFLVKPLTTNATEFSNWLLTVPLHSDDSVDYINDKLFDGICSLDANVGHAFCLDNIQLSPESEYNTALAFWGRSEPSSKSAADPNLAVILPVQPKPTPKYARYIHHNSDSVEGGLKIPLFW